jgi:hypothetical protein
MTNVSRVLSEQMSIPNVVSLVPADGFMPFMGVYVRSNDGLPLPSESDFLAADTAWNAKQAKVAANDAIKAQIAVLEASVSPRRMREAVRGPSGKAWLDGIDDRIATLRASLQA